MDGKIIEVSNVTNVVFAYIANACTLGIELKCQHRRLGCIDQPTSTSFPEQLLLEFSNDFHVVQPKNPLTIEMRIKPGNEMQTRSAVRLKIVS